MIGVNVAEVAGWFVLAGVIVLGAGYLIGQFTRGRGESISQKIAQAENAAATTIAAQSAQMELQEKTIAGLQFELSALREETERKAAKCIEDIAQANARIAALETEVQSVKDENVSLNQMPPSDRLTAIAADSVMQMVQLLGERLRPIEEGVATIIANGQKEGEDVRVQVHDK